MTAYETAKQMYDAKGESLDADILLYAQYEYLYISPENLILARCCPEYWFIQIAVGKGSLQRFIELMPRDRYRPMVAWARGIRSQNIKYYETERLRKLLWSKPKHLKPLSQSHDVNLEAALCRSLQRLRHHLQNPVRRQRTSG